ncbi:MAG: nucleoside triphosphate pyrophosphohydrolase [Peptococcaceae bacterium]|nr:nucleoside triphosphate pyrophosphohydrolase [Peptococcaceae bacterium]
MVNTITLAGLGPGDPGMLSLAAVEALTKSRRVWLRTEMHPVVEWLKEKGIAYNSFDHVYRQEDSFQDVYRRIAREVIELGREGDVLYALPGHPLVAEESSDLIIEWAGREGLKVKIIPGVSFLDALVAALKIDPAKGLNIVDGLRLDRQPIQPEVATVVIQAYSRLVLSEIKLNLMEYYPDDHPVVAVTAAGVPGRERVNTCPLHHLDRVKTVNHLTSIYIPPLNRPAGYTGCNYPLDPLVGVMARLRGREGCPWDKEQNHLTLRKYLLEEAYEVIEALDGQDMYNICEELGDLLLQIVFHAQIASEHGQFDINDVVRAITEKMIRRHPHVFGDARVESSADVIVNWAAIKEKEKPGQGGKGIFEGIPGSFPALMKAQKVQSRAAGVGFDWPDYKGALDKVYEELNEIQEAVKNGGSAQRENEIGDALFAVVNLARLLKIDAEVALSKTVNRFRRRFRYIEEKAALAGRELAECSLEQMDAWWEEIKKVEKSIKK